ncbi:MAG: hypothetical protein Q9M91_06405 [Candidatus Dojkabacteria bacterium]|nr:hypothetical protein [Candidatus Dojkabacteria bacterium]MDQ7021427.1 hypothetical protein [Candidatus Dojkabacteria bacterium]
MKNKLLTLILLLQILLSPLVGLIPAVKAQEVIDPAANSVSLVVNPSSDTYLDNKFTNKVLVNTKTYLSEGFTPSFAKYKFSDNSGWSEFEEVEIFEDEGGSYLSRIGYIPTVEDEHEICIEVKVDEISSVSS